MKAVVYFGGVVRCYFEGSPQDVSLNVAVHEGAGGVVRVLDGTPYAELADLRFLPNLEDFDAACGG